MSNKNLQLWVLYNGLYYLVTVAVFTGTKLLTLYTFGVTSVSDFVVCYGSAGFWQHILSAIIIFLSFLSWQAKGWIYSSVVDGIIVVYCLLLQLWSTSNPESCASFICLDLDLEGLSTWMTYSCKCTFWYQMLVSYKPKP